MFAELAQTAYMFSTLYVIARPSVRLSVMGGKLLQLGLCDFHHTVSPSL